MMLTRLQILERDRADLEAAVRIARENLEQTEDWRGSRVVSRSRFEDILEEKEDELAEWDRCYGLELDQLRAEAQEEGLE